MNVRVVLSAVIATVVMFGIGFLVFGVLLEPWYAQQLSSAKSLINSPPVLWSIFLAQFLISLLLAVVFERYAGIRTLAGGALAGLWMGFLIFMSFDLTMFAFYNFGSLQFMMIDALLATVMTAINGGLIGFMLGFKRA